MKSILIVEADCTMRQILVDHVASFAKGEWKTVATESGKGALEWCSKQQFECILLDSDLKDIDGLNFIRSMKRQRNHIMPIIMLIDEREIGFGNKALRAGAMDFLVKGTFETELLYQAVVNTIEKSLIVQDLEDRRRVYHDLLQEVERNGFKDERLSALLSLDLASRQISNDPEVKDFQLLMIDDDDDDLYLFSELLQETKRAVRVTTCNSFDEGLNLLNQTHWDCVLLDYKLNSGTAEDILKNWEILPPFPIIIISGVGDFRVATELFRMGATDYLMKEELSCEILWYRIDEAVKRHELLRGSQRINQAKGFSIPSLKPVNTESNQPLLYKTIIDQTDDFIFVIDRETGFVEEENATVRRLLGYSTTKHHSYRFYNLDKKLRSYDAWLDLLSKVAPEEPYHYETELFSGMGHRTAVEVKVKTFDQAGKIKIMVVAHDISKQKRVEQELRHLARTDGLTQVPNRRSLDEKLFEVWRLLVREKRPLSVIMLDVDFFKRYNDKAGHLMGDQCLRSIATALKEALNRPQDFLARYGGEEFVILLPFTDQEGAVAIAERVQQTITDLELTHPDSPISDYVTLSQGVTYGFPSTECDPLTYIRSADQALYKAKQKGRNQIVFQVVSNVE